VFSRRKGVIILTYSRGPRDVTGLGPSRPLHKWPPVKSAPAENQILLSTVECSLLFDVNEILLLTYLRI